MKQIIFLAFFGLTLSGYSQTPIQEVVYKTKTSAFEGGMYIAPNLDSLKIETLKMGESVEVFNYYSDMWMKIKYNGKIGYTREASIVFTPSIEKMIAENLKDKNPNLSRLIFKYGYDIGYQISMGLYWIGMTDQMLRDSKGRPETVNRTTTAYGTSEQWVYPNYKFFYFEGGKLTTIQD